MVRLEFDILYCWFVGLGANEAVLDFEVHKERPAAGPLACAQRCGIFVDISAFGFGSFAAVLAAAMFVGGNSMIALCACVWLLFGGKTLPTLDATWFIR